MSWRIENPPGGVGGRGVFCSAPHPDHDDVWCRRLPHKEGAHAAYVRSISVPEAWPDTSQP